METHTTAVANITADIIPSPYGPTTIDNGDPVKTSQFFRDITAVISQMSKNFGEPFTVDLLFGPHGVTVRGTTK
ncbi:hypothetical protein ACFL0N_01690 [Pseudomonadota bacterium]